MDDIFSMFGDVFGGHGGGFGGFGGFGGGGQRQKPQYRGADLRIKVTLTLQEIATGTTKKFKVKKDVTCTHCHNLEQQANPFHAGAKSCQVVYLAQSLSSPCFRQ